jgi:acetyl-CoA C-acetyltransferase
MSDADRIPVILDARRTPVGRFMGGLSNVPAPRLGSYVIDALLNDYPATKDHIEECIIGCVLQAGLGQNPARQAGLGAGLPETLSAQTVNKVCGSGLQAVMTAARTIKAGDNGVVIAGGIENMTRAPHLANVRGGVKFGSSELIDHMAYDGLRCAFEDCMMGNSADYIASKYEISRSDQDAYAARSHQLAAEATREGHFKDEIFPLTKDQCFQRKGDGVSADEGIRPETNTHALAKLRPAFAKDGTVTAGNASQISDGAAATLVASLSMAERLGIQPMAKIVAYHTSGVAPKEIFTAPAKVIPAVLEKAGLTIDDIDLFEINEAFAVQVLQNVRETGVPMEKVNICGGAIAIGHPIGCSGTRALATLLHQMRRIDARRGLVALCLGGGNAVGLVLER